MMTRLILAATVVVIVGCRERPEQRGFAPGNAVPDTANASASPADAQAVDASPAPDAGLTALVCPAGTSRHQGTWKYQEGTISAPLQWCALPDGTKHGPWRKTLANGRLIEEAEYNRGQLDGPWSSYFFADNKGRYMQGVYVHGLKDGTWQTWWGTGALAESDVFDHGVPVSSQSFHLNGQLEERGAFVAGQLSGQWERFASDGSPTLLVIYERGVEVKAWRWKNHVRTPVSVSELGLGR